MSSSAPLLCVPGTLCDGRVFQPLLQSLGAPAALTVEIGAADTVQVEAERLLATAPDRFVAVGFSLGGFVVLEMIRTAPGRVSAAVLISSNADPDDPQTAPTRRAQVGLAERRGPAAVIDALWPQYVAPPSLGRTDLQALIQDMAQSTPTEQFARQAEMNIARPDNQAWAREPTMPLLVVCGDQDALCPRERYVRAAQSRMARLAVIPDAGHFVLLEDPDGVAAAVTQWLKAAAEAQPC